jgi:putative ABC transport system permease protein
MNRPPEHDGLTIERRPGGFRELISDARFAVRTLRKDIAFTTAALATLAVGIGITTAVFTVVNGVLIRPLPYSDPSRLEMIWFTSPRAGMGNEIPLSVGFFADLVESQRSFKTVAGFQPWSPSLSTGGKPEVVSAAHVSPTFLGTLGVRPMLGRDFTATDAEIGAPDVALISHTLWQRRFAGDPAIVGKRIDIGEKSFTVIGVTPRGFAFPRGAELPAYAQFGPRTDLWAPLVINPATRQEYRAMGTLTIGRLASKATTAQARTELATILENSLKGKPKRNNPLTYDLIDIQSQAGRHIRGPLLFLMGAVLFVLFVSCANVTNLLIARTSARRREFAVRAALGAGRFRIARQLVTENLMIGIAGTALGVLASSLATKGMLTLVPGSLPRSDDIGIDWRVIAGASSIAIFIGTTLGLASTFQVRWDSLAATLRDAGARATVRRATGAARGALVVVEISLSVMLVIGAMLLASTFMQLQRRAPGFIADHAMTAGIVVPVPAQAVIGGNPANAGALAGPRYAQFYSQLIDRLSKAPGVRGAAAATSLPLMSQASTSGVRVEGEPPPELGKIPLAEFMVVEGEYFRTMGIKVLAGREFGPTDRATSAPVIVVNREFERRYLDGRALDKQLHTPFDATNGIVPRTIIGVVDDVSSTTLDEAPKPQVYLSGQQLPVNSTNIVIRTSGDPTPMLAVLEREVSALDPRAAVSDAQSLQTIVDNSLARQRFSMAVMGVFATAALFLTVVGLYGVIVLSAGERRKEIGVRLALGARSADVVRLVLSEGFRLTSMGIAIGVLGAYGLHRFVSSMLFGVSATSPLVYATSAVAIAAVALVATYAPAHRASRADPAIVLRGD